MPCKVKPWFDGRTMVRRIPKAAVRECTAPGQDASEPVRYWIRKIGFNAPEDYTREYLRATGAWDTVELTAHETNVERLFWIICGDLREDPGCPIYLEG
jgi:hypothetical protein